MSIAAHLLELIEPDGPPLLDDLLGKVGVAQGPAPVRSGPRSCLRGTL